LSVAGSGIFMRQYKLSSEQNDFIVCSVTGNRLGAVLVLHDRSEKERRRKKLEFHVKSNDYFGTLATIIDFIRVEEKIVGKNKNKILKNIKDDLLYLQNNYKIVRK